VRTAPLTSFSAIAIGRILDAGLGIALIAGLSTLGPEALGAFYFARSIAVVLVVVSDLGLSRYAMTMLASRGAGGLRIFGDIVVCRIVVNLTILPLAALMLGTLGVEPALLRTTVVLTSAMLLFAMGDLLFDVCRAHEEIVLAAGVALLHRAAYVALALGGIAGGRDLGWVVGSALATSTIFVGSSLGVVIVRHGAPHPSWSASDLLQTARNGTWFSAVSILAVVNARIAGAVLWWQHGEAALGEFAVAAQLIEAVLLLSFALNTSALPRLARTFESARETWQDGGRALLKVTFALALPAAVVIYSASDVLVARVFGHGFEEAAIVLRVAIWSVPGIFVSSAVTTLLQSMGRERLAGLLVLPLLSAMLGLSLVLIPRFGAVGAAWTILGAEAVTVGIHVTVALAVLDARHLIGDVGRLTGACMVMVGVLVAFGGRSPLLGWLAGATTYALALGLLHPLTRREYAWLTSVPDGEFGRVSGPVRAKGRASRWRCPSV
jgi:O-antigen/teichoic acid export membrane protein